VIRRALRLGLWVALAAGVAYLLSRLMRPEPPPSTLELGDRGGSLGRSPDAWPPLEAPEPTLSPVQVPDPETGPVAGTTEPGLITVGAEPFHTPPEDQRVSLSAAPAAKAAPVRKAAKKKAAAKKPAPAKKAAPKKAAPAKKAAKHNVAKKQPPPSPPTG